MAGGSGESLAAREVGGRLYLLAYVGYAAFSCYLGWHNSCCGMQFSLFSPARLRNAPGWRMVLVCGIFLPFTAFCIRLSARMRICHLLSFSRHRWRRTSGPPAVEL